MGSILSGVLGGGSSAGQDAQMQGLHAARADIQKYRPEAMQAALNAMSNASSGYQGANNALETLWGTPSSPPSVGQQLSSKDNGYGPTPQRMMGHDLPQQGPDVGTDPRYVAPRGNPQSGKLWDPFGILGGK